MIAPVSLTGTRRAARRVEGREPDGTLPPRAAISLTPGAEDQPRPTFSWLERAGVRQRSVAVAMVVVMVALAAGGGLLIVLLQQNLRDTALSAASARAAEVALLGQTQGLVETARTIQEESRSGQFVQIITAGGRVIAASNKLVADRPMSSQLPPVGQVQEVFLDNDALGRSGDWIVVARGVEIGGAALVVQVAVPVETQQQTVRTVAWFLLGAAPILIALAALAVWILVGRALRPVERIRAAVPPSMRSDWLSGSSVAADRGRDRGAGGDHERDARPAGGGRLGAPFIHLGCEPRVAEPAGRDDNGSGDRCRSRRGYPN